jgi:hypothetical protein
VSAREDLFMELCGPYQDEERANKLIDDLLHEAAEKIRDMERRNAWLERKGAGGAVLPSQVADFIDPYSE